MTSMDEQGGNPRHEGRGGQASLVPRASIVIPTYNCEAYLASTLDSVLAQCTERDEVLLIDDGSTDGTVALAQRYLSDGVRLFRRPHGGGPAGPRNQGIREARGELIFLFDSDDIMLPGKLEKTLDAAARFPDAAMFFTNFRTIDEQGHVLNSRVLDGYETTGPYARASGPVLLSPGSAYWGMTRENFVGTSGVALRRSVLRELGGFDESLSNGDDRDMWFRVMRGWDVVYIPEELHCYRIRRNSISTGQGRGKVEARIRVLKKQLALDNPPAIQRQLRHLIAENYKSKAWAEIAGGHPAQARATILEGWRYQPQPDFLKLLLRSFVGPRWMRILRARGMAGMSR